MAAKIVIDARTISSSSGRYVYKLVDYLQELDKVNSYQVLMRPEDREYWQPSQPNWEVVDAPFADFSFDEQLALGKLLAKLSPDLVHFCFPQHPVLYRGNFVVTVHDLTLLRRDQELNKQFTHFNLTGKIKTSLYRQVFKRAVNRSRHIITPTDYVKKDLIDYFGVRASKVVRIYEAADDINTSNPVPIADLANRKPFVLSVSNGLPHKNNRRLILAHQKLLSKHPDVSLALVGRLNSDQQALKSEARRQKWQKIIFTGFVDDAQLVWAYKNAAAYVFPSLSEGFGLPGLEAMQFQLPLISSNATCLPEVYGSAAQYFDPRDVGSITQAIDDVLSDDRLRDGLIARAAKQREIYDWRKTAKATLEVYQKALSC